MLHIGPHKTASTYIQQFLYQNKKLLNKKNIDYPQIGFIDCGHHQLANLLFKKQYGSAQKIINQILNIEYDTIIISSEDFDKLDLEDIKKLQELFANNCTVEIVYVKRSNCEVMLSHWQEMIKHGNTYTWSEYFFKNINNPFASRIINSCKVLDLYRSVFGNSIHIINYYLIKKNKEDIINPFFEIMGVDIDDVYKNKIDHYLNKSLDYADVEIIRILNYMHNKSTNLDCLNCVVDTSIFRVHTLLIAEDDKLYRDYIYSLKKSINANMKLVNFQHSLVFNYLENMFFDKYSKFIVNIDNENELWNNNVKARLPVNNWIFDRDNMSLILRAYKRNIEYQN